jgi:hypothetical protein
MNIRMKRLLTNGSFALFAGTVLAIQMNAETNSTYAKIVQAKTSNTVETVMRVLPEVEKLWPGQPETYFQSAKEAAGVLVGAVRKSDARNELLNLWTNVLQKPMPAEEKQVITCLEMKWDTILVYLNLEEFRSSKTRWLEIAKFIGEIRSRIIPSYSNRATLNPAVGPGDGLEKARVAIKENERNKIMDRLQQELRVKDWELISYFRLNIPARLHKDDQFIKAASSAARLTKEEVDALKKE